MTDLLSRRRRTRRLPAGRVRRRVLLRRRARFRQGLGLGDPQQRAAVGGVRPLLRPPGHPLAGRLQRLPADGAARHPRLRPPRPSQAALHPQRVGALRVPLHHRAHREEPVASCCRGWRTRYSGIWVAHGEGRLHVPDPATLDWIVENRLAPVRYVDPEREPDHHLSVQPERQPPGHRRALLAGRPPPGDHAPPRAELPAAPVALGAARVGLHATARGCGCSATPIWRCGS